MYKSDSVNKNSQYNPLVPRGAVEQSHVYTLSFSNPSTHFPPLAHSLAAQSLLMNVEAVDCVPCVVKIAVVPTPAEVKIAVVPTPAEGLCGVEKIDPEPLEVTSTVVEVVEVVVVVVVEVAVVVVVGAGVGAGGAGVGAGVGAAGPGGAGVGAGVGAAGPGGVIEVEVD